MKIDLHNYEEYALEYVEGTLQPEQQAAFEQFLDENPGIASEISSFAPVYIEADKNQMFPDKDKLKKNKTRVIPIAFSLNSWTVGVAAMLAITAFAYTWIYTGQTPDTNTEVVQLDSPEPTRDVKSVEAPMTDRSGDVEQHIENLDGKIPPTELSETIATAEEQPAAEELLPKSIGTSRDQPIANVAYTGTIEEPMDEAGDEIAQIDLDNRSSERLEISQENAEIVRTSNIPVPQPVDISLEDTFEQTEDEIAMVELVNTGSETKERGWTIKLPFGLAPELEADVNALPNSYGKIKKQKIKEALLPSFLASR